MICRNPIDSEDLKVVLAATKFILLGSKLLHFLYYAKSCSDRLCTLGKKLGIRDFEQAS